MMDRFMRFPGGKPKAFTMSYDDGCPEDIRFSETITKYGLKCTFNLNNDNFRKFNYSKEQIEDLFLSKGHEVALHGANHKANGNMSTVVGIRDVLENRLELEKKTGRIIRGMAFPDTGITRFANNTTYQEVKAYLTALGVVYARTLSGDNDRFLLPDDWHAWMPTAAHRNPKVMEYLDSFINLDLSTKVYHSTRGPRLFYLWGHSYEFERNNNWHLLTDICEKISGKDDIWYATNMEIYEYVNAYNSLVLSADETIIYNPTLLDVWFDIDGKLYRILSGETINI